MNQYVEALIGAISVLFHGEARGESTPGNEMGPLLAYLAGIAILQLAIAPVPAGLSASP